MRKSNLVSLASALIRTTTASAVLAQNPPAQLPPLPNLPIPWQYPQQPQQPQQPPPPQQPPA